MVMKKDSKINAEIVKEDTATVGHGDIANEVIMEIKNQEYRRVQYIDFDWYRGRKSSYQDKNISEELENALEVIYQSITSK